MLTLNGVAVRDPVVMRLDRMEDLKDLETSAGAGGGQNTNNMGASGQGRGGTSGLQYSIPGILHFLQHEWARFEMERGQWEVEKAELQARISFLQGERKGQENLKNDLVRRIKMLEYALKQERAKYAKLKYGNDPTGLDTSKPPLDEEGLEMPAIDGDNYIAVSNVNWRQGRQLLRQYLQEIGYTDTIIDVRSNRVRSLLGLHDGGDVTDENRTNTAINGETVARGVRANNDNASRRGVVTTLAEEMMIDNEAAVMANFEFLASEVEVDDDDEAIGDDGDDGYNPNEIKIKSGVAKGVLDQVDRDAEEVLNEFNFLTGSNSNEDSVDSIKVAGRDHRGHETSDWGISSGSVVAFSSRVGVHPSPADREPVGSNLELGELEQLTINNDNESSSYDITTPKEAFRKTWSAKYTLRSHFDGVRALTFHPTEPVLITASEDQTLKLWNLQKTVPAKKSAALDVEPVYTFRAHTGPVLALTVSPNGDLCFSGGMDTTIRCWNIPSSNVDPYDSFDAGVLAATLTGHTDAIWGLAFHGPRQQLLSSAADGTVKLWSPSGKKMLQSYGPESLLHGCPSSVDWVYEDPNHMAVAFVTAACAIYDVETGKQVIQFDTSSQDGTSVGAISRVVTHPTLPYSITGHEDRHIRFFDNRTGKQTHSMVAHLDAVTSLAVDGHGLYLISGSHDCSVRLWNLETKTCVQEITAHRKKFDESIFDVAFHPSKPYIASAGADALAKVFV